MGRVITVMPPHGGGDGEEVPGCAVEGVLQLPHPPVAGGDTKVQPRSRRRLP